MTHPRRATQRRLEGTTPPRPRLPLQYGWFFALEVAPLDFRRLDRALRQWKEGTP